MPAATAGNHGNEPTFLGSVKWVRAIQAGLIVGAILFVIGRANPWTASGIINPTIMGRELPPSEMATPGNFFGFLTGHLLLAMLYGLIIAPIVHGLRPFVAGMAGALVGLILYFLNFAAYALFFEASLRPTEWVPVIVHIVFGIITAEAYKGLAKRRVIAAA